MDEKLERVLKNQPTCAASERASEPRERSAPTPFDFAQGVVSVSRTTQRRATLRQAQGRPERSRRARERAGESEGRSPSVRNVKRGHHSVYVVYLRNPKGDGKAGYYVGMTGLSPEQRFENHRAGIKAARVVKKFGIRLVPKLYAHLNPMPYGRAKQMEVMLAESLRKRGYVVFGGH